MADGAGVCVVREQQTRGERCTLPWRCGLRQFLRHPLHAQPRTRRRQIQGPAAPDNPLNMQSLAATRSVAHQQAHGVPRGCTREADLRRGSLNAKRKGTGRLTHR